MVTISPGLMDATLEYKRRRLFRAAVSEERSFATIDDALDFAAGDEIKAERLTCGWEMFDGDRLARMVEQRRGELWQAEQW